MEQVHGKYTQKNLTAIGNAQGKVSTKLELKTPAKKVLSVTPTVLVSAVDKQGADYNVAGKVLTRAIYIDEFDGYNSEEIADNFAVTIPAKKGQTVVGNCIPIANIVETHEPKMVRGDMDTITTIQTEHIVGAGLMGLEPREVSYVTELTGDVEQKTTDREICTYNESYFEKFDIGEMFALTSDVEGVLGVELNASVRDVICRDNKVTVKGTAIAGVSTVKSVDANQTIVNTFHEFEFSKTFNKPATEIVCANVLVCDVQSKVEHREKPELVLEASLIFTGYSVHHQTIKSVDDAFSCTHNLDFQTAKVTHTLATAQTATTADIEGNVTMPNGSPFITKVLWASAGNISSINVKPADDKVTVEGVLNTNLVYECDNGGRHSHTAQIPFSTTVKIDGITADHNVAVTAVPLSCNIKARRGKELLVDARIGLNACGNRNEKREIVSAVTLGSERTTTPSAITIHIAQNGETLWDIAKHSCVKTAEVLRQNPGLENGVNDGERITLYRKKVVNI